MKKFASALFVFIMMFYIIFPLSVSADSIEQDSKKGVTINVYNWGEYISDGVGGTLDVNKEFTKRTGIKVNYTTFQSNEELFAKLSSGGASYDVIIPSDYMVNKLIKKEMLRKIDFSKISNFSKIDESFLNPQYDVKNEYSVPYAWGLVGIFYNKNIVTEEESKIDWDILWNEKYKGKILMFDNSRDAFGIAQIKMGKSVNSTNPKDWIDAAEELRRQKPLVQAYVMDQIFDKMGNGEAAVAPYYAGDAALLIRDNKDIGFVIPKEGTNKFIDAMCIPKGSKHPNEAQQYINFMCETDIAAANIDYIGYSTPQKEVRAQLDPEIANNEMFYPTKETLKKAQVFSSLPEDIGMLLDDLWVEVKADGNGNTAALIVVLSGFLLVYVVVVAYKKFKLREELNQI